MMRMSSKESNLQKSKCAHLRLLFLSPNKASAADCFRHCCPRSFFKLKFKVTSHSRVFQMRSSLSFSHYVTKSKLERLFVSHSVVVSAASSVSVLVVEVVVEVVAAIVVEVVVVVDAAKVAFPPPIVVIVE